MKVILASHNLHKIREFREIFRSLPFIELLSLHQFPDIVLPEETGITFRENAIIKAKHVADALGHLAIGDDSGLVVPAINGEPGIFSARYAGENKSDLDNCLKLMDRMRLLEGLQRTAYYECCLAVASPDGLIKSVEGICEGMILKEPRGRNGFGYDPYFVKTDYDKTFAEMDESLKNRISHRRKAFDRLLSFFETLKN